MIIKGKGKEPIVLLTTEEIKDEKDALRVLEIYLTRWRCEESFRFIKQGYNLEDIRLLTYEGLVHAAINEGIYGLLFDKKFNTAPSKKSKFIQPTLPFFSESF